MTDIELRNFLNRLEEFEARLLTWGVVDGGFSEDELLAHAEETITNLESDVTSHELIDALQDRRLLFRINVNGNYLYRTRTAETVRLLTRLRQWFHGKPWQVAPSLVSDFRFQLRSRAYPRRHLSSAHVIDEVARAVNLSDVLRSALLALMAGAEESLQLADFQQRATIRMLRDLQVGQRASRGMIVAAGTGTGKTLAFYLPALSHVASLVTRQQHWTKAIAIYPRNELLKDQFAETYDQARKLDDLMRGRAARKITIGAFFGPTPQRASAEDLEQRGWKRQPHGFVCPYLPCPHCGQALIWPDEDIDEKIERLVCTNSSCGHRISDEEVLLTRERMIRTPPDVLFTSTEMLNRQMSDSRSGHVFGIGASQPPQIMLLDEVHTYEGVHGAQVAHLLRRWRHALGRNSRVQFTGLSATLRNAGGFLAQLVGLKSSAVEEIGPGEDLEQKGKEYQLLLRGDPASGTTLLSTTIQAAMLLRRILDPATQNRSGGFLGSRVFAFTDDLDVTNRLYHSLLDAEGRDSWGRAIPNTLPLAALRRVAEPRHAERMANGQSWYMCEQIGFDLLSRLLISRTSSQDVGVDISSDVVIATAALEVGYNDPKVGAVIQHKAPRSMASFLQRKGRAGRPRDMRPWTVVVLSDYGRDRLAYLNYEQLFDPMLDARTLPLSNRYVLRMQAVYAFMDWMRWQIPQSLPRGSVWADLAGPASGQSNWADDRRERQAFAANRIELLLSVDPSVRDDLADHIERALQVPESVVRSILWERPRPLMTGVLPTILRRLKSGWKRLPIRTGESDDDLYVFDHPLPEFIPAQLFSDLNLPELMVLSQRRRDSDLEDVDTHLMPIVQGLRTLAPGKVTRRFAVSHGMHSHWMAPPTLDQPAQEMPVESFCEEFDDIGPVQIMLNDEVRSLRCIRPWRVRTTLVPANVSPTSNSQLRWRTQIAPIGSGVPFDAPANSNWARLVPEVCFFVHHHASHVQVRRFAIGSEAGIRFRDGSTLDADIRFVDAAEPAHPLAAVGFSEEVDGIVFRCRIPESLAVAAPVGERNLEGLRVAYFRHLVINDTALGSHANSFQREWLVQVFLSTLTAIATDRNLSLEAASDAFGRTGTTEMEAVMDAIFQSLTEDADTNDGSADESAGTANVRQRMHAELLALCHDGAVVDRLIAMAPVLWNQPDDSWEQWARECFTATLGQAILSACQSLCPEFAADELYLDLDAGPRAPGTSPPMPGLTEIWITESTPGGGGVVEEILQRYADNPRRFFHLVEAALGPSDGEIVDAQLTRILGLTESDDILRDALEGVRSAIGNDALHHATQSLLTVLASRDVLVSHSVAAAVQTRIVRPGSSSQTDVLLRRLLDRWRDLEQSLGIEIDARVFAYVSSRDAAIADAIDLAVSQRDPDPFWRFNIIYGLLWARGSVSASQALRAYNPFAPLPEPNRRLVLDVLGMGRRTVHVEQANWRAQTAGALGAEGAVDLLAQTHHHTELKHALLNLAEQPLEIGFLSLFPQVGGVGRDSETISVRVDLREAVQ